METTLFWSKKAALRLGLFSFFVLMLAHEFGPFVEKNTFFFTKSPLRVGDRVLSSDAWNKLVEAIRCWTQEGGWARENSLAPSFASILPPMYDPHVPESMRNPGHFNYNYRDEICGSMDNRVGLDLRWAVPLRCAPIPKFSPKAMCQTMRGRTLMFIGDSISVAHFEATLQAMAHGRPAWDGNYESLGTRHPTEAFTTFWDYNALDENPVVSHSYSFCSSEPQPSDPFSMMLTANPKLQGYEPIKTPPVTPQHKYWMKNRLFLKREHDTHGLVLVINQGAWYEDDIIVNKSFSSFLRMVREDMPNTTVIFRSTNSPHAKCENFFGDATFDPSEYIFDNDFEHPEWHWQQFLTQSQRVVQPLIIAAQNPAAIFLDITPSSKLRPDQHCASDCLHFCIPSPLVDMWIHILYGVLASIETVYATS